MVKKKFFPLFLFAILLIGMGVWFVMGQVTFTEIGAITARMNL